MSTHTASFSRLIMPYQEKIESYMRLHIESLGAKTFLHEACHYALFNGGKRFRPALILMIAEALGNKYNVMEAALAVEFFHTASLIADDLPCMDNDAQRRNKPTLHKVYGESVAILATYVLISEGYASIARNAQELRSSSLALQSDTLCLIALENATYYTGILGATGGQFSDIFPSHLSLEMLYEIIEKKSVSLFIISFVLGWIFGGGDLDKIPIIKQSATHFGIAFQIADDWKDRDQDRQKGRLMNFVNMLGEAQAKKRFLQEIDAFLHTLSQASLNSEELLNIAEMLKNQIC